MALIPRLEIRQGQSLVMTPQLQQAIKLLQMSNLEVSAFVEQELERNPVLEREDGEASVGGSTIDDPPGDSAAVASSAENGEIDGLSLSQDGPPPDAHSDLDTDLSNVYADAGPADGDGMGYAAIGRGGDSSFDNDEATLDSLADHPTSLRDHLLKQLGLATDDAVTRLIGTQVIDLVDHAGYLDGAWVELAARLGVDQQLVDDAIKMVQGFDPTGVAARDLRECLVLQLRERNRLDPMISVLLDNLALLGRRDHSGLMRLCACDSEDLSDMIAEIKRLNPKPGLGFEIDEAETLIPDVFVRRAPDGAWTVEINADTLPKLLIDHRYAARISGADKQTKSYVTDCMASANWLIRSLDQRARTILKVATEIVRFQDAFLNRGISFLRPLTLKSVADEIEMHESTVSRVTANKYLATPRGVFEFKYFFTAGINNSDGGEAHSAEAVRHRIKSLIDAEVPASILSDDRLVEMLKSDGIDIARRTVAKYRESLRIPSSVDRRRLKAGAFSS
jgi:RNA polymerase sigma-54 factor